MRSTSAIAAASDPHNLYDSAWRLSIANYQTHQAGQGRCGLHSKSTFFTIGFLYNQGLDAMPQTAKISSKGQVTVPIAIRKALNANPGDFLIWDVADSGSVVVRRAREVDVSYLSSVSGTLSEWNSDVDEEAFADL